VLKQRLDYPFHTRIETTKKLLKQRLDFPFEKRIETTDTLPARKSRKSCSNNGEIFYLTKELKRRRDCLQEEAKTSLKQKLDFLF